MLPDCSGTESALGVHDENTIPNNQISASSEYEYSFFGSLITDYRADEGRLNSFSGYWATLNDPPTVTPVFIQVDLGKKVIVTGIQTQGNVPEITQQTDVSEFVSELSVKYGDSEATLAYVGSEVQVRK